METIEKNIAVLEIKNKSYKLVVGYLSDNKVEIIYKNTYPLSVFLREADIFNVTSLAEDLMKFKRIDDQEHKLKINLGEVVLIFPSYGLEVYNSIKVTNTISNISRVDKIDINNVVSMIRKQKIPNANNSLVDVIPNFFVTDGDKKFLEPPIGEISSQIAINANVYTLPTKMMFDMKKAVYEAGLKVKKEVIGPIGVSYMLSKKGFKYKTYVMIDVSARTTILTFVGDNAVFSSNYFNFGGDNLVDLVVNKMDCSIEKARELIDIYGLDLRNNRYNPSIFTSKMDENGLKRSFTKEDLNDVISIYLDKWSEYLINALKTLLVTNGQLISSIPFVLNGEFSEINGLEEYIHNKFKDNPFELLKSEVVGCEDLSYLNCIGAIYYGSIYKGSLEDSNAKRVSNISRIELKKEEYSETKDEL